MQLWLDSTNLDLIKKASRSGILYGVTTNPTILAQAKNPPETVIQQLLDIQNGPVTAQLLAETPEEMMQEAMRLNKISYRIIIKVPVTDSGLQVIHRLSQNQVMTMATVIYESRQVYLAALAGADYAAPYFSRMHQVSEDAPAQIAAMQKIISNYNFRTKLIVASLKTVDQISMCLDLGVSAITVKDSLFNDLLATNPHTAAAVEQFLEDSLQTAK